MAMNSLYDPSIKGTGEGGDYGPKAETWWPKNDGDKISGAIVYVGKPEERRKLERFIEEGKKETQLQQKIVIDVDGTLHAIYIKGRLFKKLGEAMAEHGLSDFTEATVKGWGFGHKWEGLYVDDKGKPQKDLSFKLFKPGE